MREFEKKTLHVHGGYIEIFFHNVLTPKAGDLPRGHFSVLCERNLKASRRFLLGAFSVSF